MWPALHFQLRERGYHDIDATDGSEGMLLKAKEKGIYKNCITALIGRTPIEGVQKGMFKYITTPLLEKVRCTVIGNFQMDQRHLMLKDDYMRPYIWSQKRCV